MDRIRCKADEEHHRTRGGLSRRRYVHRLRSRPRLPLACFVTSGHAARSTNYTTAVRVGTSRRL